MTIENDDPMSSFGRKFDPSYEDLAGIKEALEEDVWARYDEGLRWHGPYPYEAEFPWDAYESEGYNASSVPVIRSEYWLKGRAQAVERGAGDSGWKKWGDGDVWVPGDPEPVLIPTDQEVNVHGFFAVVQVGEKLPEFWYSVQ